MKNILQNISSNLLINDLKYNLTWVITSIFIVAATQTIAQKSITTTQLLSDKPMVEGDEIIQNNLHFLKETKQGLPLVNTMEIRTETDELDISQQEYLFRLSFNTKKSRKVQNELTKNKIHFYELKSKIMEDSKLLDRYKLIVEWYYIQQNINHLKTEKLLKEDQKIVYQKKLANSLAIDVDDLLKVNKDLQEIERKDLMLNFKKEYVIQQFFPEMTLSDSLVLKSNNWISLKNMAFILDGVYKLPTSNMDQILQDAKIEYEQLELDKKKAESKQILDFVQFKYAGNDNLAFQKELSFGMGINIPTKSSSRVTLNEAKLKIFDEQYKQELQKVNLEKKISDYSLAFNSLLKEYNLIKQQISDNNLEETLKNYSSTGAVDPITLLRIKSSLISNKLNLQNIEKQACLVYLDILADKGVLNQSPNLNYLSENLNYYNIK